MLDRMSTENSKVPDVEFLKSSDVRSENSKESDLEILHKTRSESNNHKLER